MNDQYTRRSFLKKAYRLTIGTTLTILFGYTYARFIEPKQLEVTEHSIRSSFIPEPFDGVKILQFSDTHIGHYYDARQLEQLVETINHLKPDLVLFTGDLIDAPDQYGHPEELIPILKKIVAPLGKFAIYGNHDHGGYGTESYKIIMELSDFQLLVNSYIPITVKNSSIYLAGLDDYMLGRPDFEQTLGKIPENSYTIFLAHEPDVAKVSHSYPVQLQLSGHSHGGQIQIPFIGPIVTPPYGTEYVEGFYSIGQKPLTLYVNRGLGTTRVPFRFFSKPEISLFTLKAD
ncbi:metallophosphoesterase [Bacillus salitolerans]|uniref:Metallophosphoesterase n=1 Tax=Bacillus salitolerans TaxID=1437434 RepID=A0ABW4LK78_9BACI